MFYEDEADIHLNLKSVQTGRCAGSKSALPRRARMKSTISPVRCAVLRAIRDVGETATVRSIDESV